MKKIVVMFLGVVILCSLALGTPRTGETFEVAGRVGEPNKLSFFRFTTSAGNWIFRHDGMGECSLRNGRRRVVWLKVGGRGRIEQVYYLEHDGDLFLLYEVHDASSEWTFLGRMEQTQRKFRWLSPVEESSTPMIEGDRVIVGTTEFNKADGKILSRD